MFETFGAAVPECGHQSVSLSPKPRGWQKPDGDAGGSLSFPHLPSPPLPTPLLQGIPGCASPGLVNPFRKSDLSQGGFAPKDGPPWAGQAPPPSPQRGLRDPEPPRFSRLPEGLAPPLLSLLTRSSLFTPGSRAGPWPGFPALGPLPERRPGRVRPGSSVPPPLAEVRSPLGAQALARLLRAAFFACQ